MEFPSLEIVRCMFPRDGFVNIIRLHFRRSRASVDKRNIIISVRTHQSLNTEMIA